MLFIAPGVELTAMGRAMSEGGVGDTVTVQNPASYRMIIRHGHRARHGARHRPASPAPHQHHRPPIGFRHAQPDPENFRHCCCWALALSACSALDRLENIGEAPKLAPVGNPAGTQIVAAIPRAAADHPCRQFAVAAGRAELLPRSARHSCRRCDHRECLGRRYRQAAEHHLAHAAPIPTMPT